MDTRKVRGHAGPTFPLSTQNPTRTCRSPLCSVTKLTSQSSTDSLNVTLQNGYQLSPTDHERQSPLRGRRKSDIPTRGSYQPPWTKPKQGRGSLRNPKTRTREDGKGGMTYQVVVLYWDLEWMWMRVEDGWNLGASCSSHRYTQEAWQSSPQTKPLSAKKNTQVSQTRLV